MNKKIANVPKEKCVACGSCTSVCPTGAISVYKGMYAVVDKDVCVGCFMCAKRCPASIITRETYEKQ